MSSDGMFNFSTLLRFYFDFKPKFVVSLRRSKTDAGAMMGAKIR